MSRQKPQVGRAETPRTGRKCPICGRAAAPDHRPFCSHRCSQIDLNRWLSGAYVIAAPEVDDAEDGQPEG